MSAAKYPKIQYWTSNDIFSIKVSGKRIVREVAEGWNVSISYAADGSVVDVVMLDFMASAIEPARELNGSDLKRRGASTVAQTAKTHKRRLTPSPKALQKALVQSAKQAQRMADAFGLIVPSIKPKNAPNPRKTG